MNFHVHEAKHKVVPLYRAVMLEFERRRLHLGLSMEALSDRVGFADRYYAKTLYPDTPSGRQARWETLQEIADALFPEGYDIEIRPKTGLRLGAEDLKCKIRFAAAPTDRKSQRDLMRELGRKGAAARAKLPANRLKQIARLAAKTRKKNKRFALRATPKRDATSPQS